MTTDAPAISGREAMSGQRLRLALVATVMMFAGVHLGQWMRDDPGTPIPTLVVLVSCCAASWGWTRWRRRR